MAMIANFYTSNWKFLAEEEAQAFPAIGTEITKENPSGLIFTGLVTSIVADSRFEDEYAVILEGKWEWES